MARSLLGLSVFSLHFALDDEPIVGTYALAAGDGTPCPIC